MVPVTRILLTSLFFLLLLLPILDIMAENAGGPFRDNCPRYPVCLMPNVKLNTKYGQLTALRPMIFNAFYVNANGTVYFDAQNWIPQAEEILLFNMQSYGNGTFEVQVWGPPATAANCQGCSNDFHLSTGMPRALGADLFFAANMASLLQLTINYTPFGGACGFVCIGGSALAGAFLFAAGIIFFIGLLVVFTRRRKVTEYEMEVGH